VCKLDDETRRLVSCNVNGGSIYIEFVGFRLSS